MNATRVFRSGLTQMRRRIIRDRPPATVSIKIAFRRSLGLARHVRGGGSRERERQYPNGRDHHHGRAQ
jgi:hypothetical protein